MVARIKEPLIDSRMGATARTGSAAAGAPLGRPEAQSMPQRADQVIQLVEQLHKSFHRWWPAAQRRRAPGAGSTGSSPFSLRQAVRTLSAQDL